jgi:hypothetical protein
VLQRKENKMTDDAKRLDKDACHMARSILYGAAYSAGVMDLLVMVCRRILANHEPGEDQQTLFKDLYDELQAAFGNLEVPSLEDMLQLAKHNDA